jgi:hypothetical protein
VLFEACTLGRFNQEVSLEFTIPVGGTEVPYLSCTFHHLLFASYRVHAESFGPATATETLSLTYKNARWRSFRVNPVTGEQTNEISGVRASPTVGLSSTTVAKKSRAGTVVGRLSTPHGYTNDTHAYKLVAGAGSRDGDEIASPPLPVGAAGVGRVDGA